MELTEQSPAAISTEITVESGRLAERQEQAQPFIPPPQCFFFDNKGQIIWNSIHDLSHENIIKKKLYSIAHLDTGQGADAIDLTSINHHVFNSFNIDSFNNDHCSINLKQCYTRKKIRGGFNTSIKLTTTYQCSESSENSFCYTCEFKKIYLVQDVSIENEICDVILINLDGHGTFYEIAISKPEETDRRKLISQAISSGDYIYQNPLCAIAENTYHNTFSFITTDCFIFPSSLIAINIENWNSSSEAMRLFTRSVGGFIYNASTDQEMGISTAVHVVAAIMGTWIMLRLFDGYFTPNVQQACGLPKISYTGGAQATDEQLTYISLSSLCMCIFGFSASAYKEAFAITMKHEAVRAKKRSMAKWVAIYEIVFNKVLSNTAASGALIAGKLGNPVKICLDNQLPQMIGAGGGGILQAVALAKGMTPFKAFLIYQLCRVLVFRPGTVLTQALTTKYFLGTPYVPNANETGYGNMQMLTFNGSEAFYNVNGSIYNISINEINYWNTWHPFLAASGISQLGGEMALGLVGFLTYWCGLKRHQDGSEEQMMAYSAQKNRPVHFLNKLRMTLQRGMDKVTTILSNKVITPLSTRLISCIENSPFVTSCIGLDDDDYQAILNARLQAREIKNALLTQTDFPEWAEQAGDDPQLDATRYAFLMLLPQQREFLLRQFIRETNTV